MKKKRILWITIGIIVLTAVGFGIYTSTIDSLPDSSYALFDKVALPKATDRIMVVSPHQDDEVIGAGIYINEAIKAGAQMEIVFATDGNKHGLKDTRNQEAMKADAVLGVPESDITFFGFPDGDLSGHQTEFNARLADQIQSFKPTTVITTMVQDIHPDHSACGVAVEAAAKTNTSFDPLYFLVHYHRYPRPIGYEPEDHLLPPISLLSAYDWQTLPLTSSQISLEKSAIDQYKSQTTAINPVLTQLVYSFDRQNELFASPKAD